MVKKTQKTPKGYEIPVPTKGEFIKNLEKTAKKSPPNSTKK